MQNIEVALKLVDKFSAELRKMGEAVQGLEGSIQKQVKQMNTHFDHLQSSISKTAQSTQKHFQGIQNGMSAMSTNFVKNALAMGAGIFAIDKAAEALMSFDDARARVVGLAGLKGKDVQTLTDSALKIGGSTEFDPADVMGGFGVNARFIKDIQRLKDVVAVETDLATIGQTTITAVAQDMAPLVGILELSGQQLIEFGDIVAFVNSKNSKSLSSNLEAMTKSIDVMRLYGNTTKDTAAILAIAPAVSAFEGSELGTNLRSMMNGLDATTRLARKGNIDNVNVLRQLGLSPDDIDLTKRKLIDVLTVISKARNRDGTTANGTQFGQLFGEEGKVLAAALVPAVDQIKEVTKQLDNVKGKLGEMSAPMRATLRANLGNAAGAVEELMVKLGDAGLTGAIISVANAFTVFVNFLARNPIIVNVATQILLFAAGLWSLKKILTPVITGFMMLRKAALILRVGMILAGGALPALAAGFSTLFLAIRAAFTANPLGTFITGIMLAYTALNLLYKLWKKFKGEADVSQAVQGGQSQAVQGGAFWEKKDGQMIPYTQQSKQKITTDVNVIFENPPEGTKAVATQRGTSGVDVGTTNILKDITKGLGF